MQLFNQTKMTTHADRIRDLFRQYNNEPMTNREMLLKGVELDPKFPSDPSRHVRWLLRDGEMESVRVKGKNFKKYRFKEVEPVVFEREQGRLFGFDFNPNLP